MKNGQKAPPMSQIPPINRHRTTPTRDEANTNYWCFARQVVAYPPGNFVPYRASFGDRVRQPFDRVNRAQCRAIESIALAHGVEVHHDDVYAHCRRHCFVRPGPASMAFGHRIESEPLRPSTI